MATIEKRKNGSYRARIRKNGITLTQTFAKKAHADIWAKKIEVDISQGRVGFNIRQAEKISLATVIADYVKDYPLTHDGKEAGYGNRKAICAYFKGRPLSSITSAMLMEYRNMRATEGRSASTVNKDLTLINAAIKHAQRRGVQLSHNPALLAEKMRVRDARERRLKDGEEEKILHACKALGQNAFAFFVRLALETAMRSGELLALQWESVNLRKKVCFLEKTKNGDARTIPLSIIAHDILSAMAEKKKGGRVFPYWRHSSSVAHLWRKVMTQAGIGDLRFHDLRHEATSRLFELGFDSIRVAMITGHKSPSMPKRYAHLKAADLVIDMWRKGKAGKAESLRGGSREYRIGLGLDNEIKLPEAVLNKISAGVGDMVCLESTKEGIRIYKPVAAERASGVGGSR